MVLASLDEIRAAGSPAEWQQGIDNGEDDAPSEAARWKSYDELLRRLRPSLKVTFREACPGNLSLDFLCSGPSFSSGLSKVQRVQLIGQPAVFERNDKWKVKEEVVPVSFLCVVENKDKLEELDEEGIEDPEEGEVSPVGMVVIGEVKDESLNIRSDVEEWQNHVEQKKLE